MRPQTPQEHLIVGRAALAKALCADWISTHSGILFASFATLIVLTFCTFQISNRFFSAHKADSIRAEQAFRAWVATKGADAQLLQRLESPLNREPTLKAKFGAQIAQRLLVLGDLVKAQDYARAALKRTLNLTSSYYTRFSNNTLSISSGNYEQALKEAKQFKIDLEQDQTFWTQRDKAIRSGTVLFAYNLLRIASLERALGSVEGELAAWNDLMKNAGWDKQPPNSPIYDRDAYAQLAANFQQGETSLLDFIKKRQSALQIIRE